MRKSDKVAQKLCPLRQVNSGIADEGEVTVAAAMVVVLLPLLPVLGDGRVGQVAEEGCNK